MSKHTRGKWLLLPSGKICSADDGTLIVFSGAISGKKIEESIANTRLISTAPELLEALEMLLGRVISDQEALNSDYGPSGREIIEQARAAIAKAKGAA